MDWHTELIQGYSYTIGAHVEGGQQSKQPVVILRKNLNHAEETTRALNEIEERQRAREAQERVGSSDCSGVPFDCGGRCEEVGGATGSVPDLHSGAWFGSEG